LYKEFVLLDLIEKNEIITQRQMSDYLDVSVSMVNSYLDSYEQKGYIKREYKNSKTVKYIITSKGIERKKVLNIGFLKDSQSIYFLARKNINTFLKQIVNRGFKKILLYGAGEVAEILLSAINTDPDIPINVIGVIDDDEDKQGNYLLNQEIESNDRVIRNNYDGIFISSYNDQDVIEKKLLKKNVNTNKMIKFFY
ncbi:MAG: winged helix-turn-helix transcriptional regulator, partial [Halanaerobiales bacterium]|nr:winged helix-turn-helix transcriptional regulator [Halanaerobiales bacterium]